MNELAAGAAFWNELARRDPLWAILSAPDRRENRWDLETFFATGEREISLLLHQMDGLPEGRPSARRTAMDFGCGVGRLTQALANHFEHVVGVDVSHVMLEHASRLNAHGDRVKYVLNESDSLAVLGDERFDLVYTDLVLQHLPPDLAMKYLRELLERVAPGGVIVFQLPSVRRPVQRPTPSPLRDDAYHAAIELIAGECSMTGASDFVIKVTNSSKSTWSNGVFRLGNHWLDEAGAMLVQDDARAGLPAPFHPGQVAVVTLTPAEPPGAAAILEFDVVHEGLTWFSDKGSPTLRLRAADVVAASGGAAADALQPHHLFVPGIASDEAVSFPMHGVRRDEVERLISEAGMSLVLAEVDERGGPEWEGYRYFVRRRL